LKKSRAIAMNRNVKYKQICSIGIFGDDDIFTSTSSQYSSSGNFTNAKRMGFPLNLHSMI
jgi:hypothetical protein